jgi:hypothetical protein
MADMVEKVVEALNRNPFMDHNRVLRSAIRKRNLEKVRYRRIKRPAKITGERDTFEKERERERKDIKRAHPTAKLNYNATRKKWEIKARDVLQKKEEIEAKYNLHRLEEIAVRTSAIGIWLATIKKWASTVDSLAASIKSKASAFDTADTIEKRNKIEKELWTIQSDSDKALRKMIIYGSLISAAGGLGIVKNYKEIKKQLSKRRK